MKHLSICLAVLLFAVAAFAQGPSPCSTFSINASVVALSSPASGAIPASDVGGTFCVTDKLALREDSILAPAADLQAHLGGVNYALPNIWLAKTKLDPAQFQFYLTGSIGVGIAGDSQHIAALAGAGANYDPLKSGKFSVNLFEVRWAKLPGFNNSTAIFSSGIGLHW